MSLIMGVYESCIMLPKQKQRPDPTRGICSSSRTFCKTTYSYCSDWHPLWKHGPLASPMMYHTTTMEHQQWTNYHSRYPCLQLSEKDWMGPILPWPIVTGLAYHNQWILLWTATWTNVHTWSVDAHNHRCDLDFFYDIMAPTLCILPWHQWHSYSWMEAQSYGSSCKRNLSRNHWLHYTNGQFNFTPAQFKHHDELDKTEHLDTYLAMAKVLCDWNVEPG